MTSFITKKESKASAVLDPPFYIFLKYSKSIPFYLRPVEIEEFFIQNLIWVWKVDKTEKLE